MNTIAITDHDTVSGLKEAKKRASKIEIISGIELSTYFRQEEVHLLGYFFDENNQEFLAFLDSLQKARKIRLEKMLAKLKKLQINLTASEKLLELKNPGRMHLADLLIRQGFVKDYNTAFRLYLGNSAPAYVAKKQLDCGAGLEFLRKFNGLVVLAHPFYLNDFTKVISYLKPLGLKGLEVIHSDHSPSQIKYLLNYALKNQLLPTSGSDCHGLKNEHGEIFLGKIKGPQLWVENLKKESLK